VREWSILTILCQILKKCPQKRILFFQFRFTLSPFFELKMKERFRTPHKHPIQIKPANK
jgi:hypothetical protein